MTCEQDYQKALECILGGKHHVGSNGISDITTGEFHAEIKYWRNWKSVIGQLSAYNAASPKNELRAYFFGQQPPPDKTQNIMNIILDNFKGHEVFILFFNCQFLDEKTLAIKNLRTGEETVHIVDARCPKKKHDKLVTCERCHKSTSRTSQMIIHLKSSTPCPCLFSDITREDVIKSLSKSERSCAHCKKVYTSKKCFDKHVTVCSKVKIDAHKKQAMSSKNHQFTPRSRKCRSSSSNANAAITKHPSRAT